MNLARTSRRRLALTLFAVFAIVGIFVVRLVDLQVVRADDLMRAADQRTTRSDILYGTRGSIVDANGVILADSVDRFDITAAPVNVKPEGFDRSFTKDGQTTTTHVSLADAISEISAATGVDTKTLTDAVTADPKANFAYLAKGVKLDVFNRVKALKIPWVYSQPHPARTYPEGAIAGNLVGFVGTDGPQAGLELSQNACLAEKNGTSTYEAGGDGVRMPGSTVVQTKAKDGGTLKLTIDADLQWFAQQAIAKQARAVGADWATGMVVRVKDGHIMAAADYPTVDPNDRNSVKPDSLGARLFSSPYEPGSVIKVATFASLLDTHAMTIGTKILVPGAYYVDGAKITDSFYHGDLRYTAAGVLENSSNIGVSLLSLRAPASVRHNYLDAFGFGHKTAVGFLGESSGELVPTAELDPITNVTQQFGQGMSATSAQVASMYQAIGNNGVKMPLTLVEGCQHADGTVTDLPDTTPTRVVGATAAKQTVEVMETVASQGALHDIISIPGYRVAAKTGTAQVAQNGSYGTQRIVSVAGLIPAENPQYVVIATMAKPDTIRTSAAAAPAFAAIMKQVIKTFQITPSRQKAPYIPLTW